VKVPSKSHNNNGSVTEGQCIFTIAPCSVIPIMRYNSDKHYKNVKQNVMFYNLFPKFMPFIR